VRRAAPFTMGPQAAPNPGARWVALVVALFALLAPAVAAACPQCAGRSDDGGPARWVILAAFVLFPFGVAAVVLRVIRSGESDEPRPARAARAPGVWGRSAAASAPAGRALSSPPPSPRAG
jgi:hypothetical protein